MLVSHLGRPKDHEPELSLAPVARRLSELLGVPVQMAPAVVGEEVTRLTEALQPGELLMLENVRYEPGETKNDAELVAGAGGARRRLCRRCLRRCSSCPRLDRRRRRADARRAPPGCCCEREVDTLRELVEAPARPLVAILGGAKVSDKIKVIERFLEVADTILIGGAMAFPFLKAQGHAVGDSLCADEDVELAGRLLALEHQQSRPAGAAQRSGAGRPLRRRRDAAAAGRCGCA